MSGFDYDLFVIGGGLLVYAASRSLDFVQTTLPAQDQVLGYFALLATSGVLAPEITRRVIARLALVTLIALAGLVTLGYLEVRLRHVLVEYARGERLSDERIFELLTELIEGTSDTTPE